MFKKRGQGLSITVIVAAVIGLIVLVVIVAVLTGRLGGFSKGVDAASRRYNQKLCGYWNGIYFERLYNCLYISYITACTSATSATPAGAGGSVVISKDAIASGKFCCTK